MMQEKAVSKAVRDLLRAFADFPLRLTGIAAAGDPEERNGFSVFGVTEADVALSIHMGRTVVYLCFEGEEEMDEEALVDLFQEAMERAMPHVRELVRLLPEKGGELLHDEMGPEMKEFIYGMLIKHLKGENVYEQTEAA
ncbi:hypothetical protein [Thermococcus sp.]|uniref:hypothetical protein n=1 Tax=Thermococcus sp. TaxID=35749 RepID=UPI0026224422|nr:hypothetical protein [Thermococcus sp.]